MADVGLSVQEGVANGVTPFTEASKHVIALLMERKRGKPNKVVTTYSLQEDRVRFGGMDTSMFGPVVLRNLYNNAGVYGAVVKGVRIIGAGTVAAAGTLTDGAPANQALVVAQTQASAGPSTPEIKTFTPANVSVGDIFRVIHSGVTISFTATAPTVANVTAGLRAAIVAYISGNPGSAWATNTQSTSDAGTHIVWTGTNGGPDVTITSATVNAPANDIIDFTAGQEGVEDPGTWGNDLQILVYPKDHPNGVAGAYLVVINLEGANVENFTAENWTDLITVLNERSLYVMAAASGVNSLVHDITDIQTVTFTGGAYVAPVEADFYPAGTESAPEGLNILNGHDVQLIGCTEHQTVTMAAELKTYATVRADCLAVITLPYLADTSVVTTFATALQEGIASFICGYNFWIKTSDGAGGFMWAPSLGAVLGAGFIRVPKLQRDHVWITPAGVESVLRDLVDITPNPLPKELVNLWVQRYTTNVAVFREGKGFFLYSSRTYSTNELYHSIHVRRMTNWLVKMLESNMLFLVQKNITPELRQSGVVAISAFFKGVYDDGGLEKTIPFAEACEIISDKTNNPATQSRKINNIDINWIPVECAESVPIRLNRNDGVLIVKALSA